jgi:hypothetical protein
MIWVLVPISFAQDEYALEEKIIQVVQSHDITQVKLLLQEAFPTTQHWTGNSPKAYSKALFPTPSLLANLNVNKVEHELIPNIDTKQQHDFLRIQTDTHHLTLGFVNEEFDSGLLSIHQDYLQPVGSPFQQDRLSVIFNSLDNIFINCSQVTPTDRDIYNNAIAWKGEDCDGAEIFARYLPTEEYSLQVLIHSKPKK